MASGSIRLRLSLGGCGSFPAIQRRIVEGGRTFSPMARPNSSGQAISRRIARSGSPSRVLPGSISHSIGTGSARLLIGPCRTAAGEAQDVEGASSPGSFAFRSWVISQRSLSTISEG